MVHRCLHGVSEGAGDCEAVACGVSGMQTASYTTDACSVNDMAYSARAVQGVSWRALLRLSPVLQPHVSQQPGEP